MNTNTKPTGSADTASNTLARKSRSFGVPYIAVIGNNSAINQIRSGQVTKYGEERGDTGNLLGDVPFSKFGEMLDGYGEEVTQPRNIASALHRARQEAQKSGKCTVIDIWVDPSEYAPGTKAQTMYNIDNY